MVVMTVHLTASTVRLECNINAIKADNYLQRMVMKAVAEQKSNIHVGIHFTQNTKLDLVSLDKTGGSASEKPGLMCSILSVQSLL